MPISRSELLSLLYRALSSKIGLRIETNEPEKLRQRFYVARKTDPALANIAVRADPSGTAICLTPERQDAPSSPP